MISFHTKSTVQNGIITLTAVLLLTLFLKAGTANAQTFSSGSTGSDGALNLTTAEHGPVYVFDPANFAARPVGNFVFDFTTINIEAGVTVKMSASQLNGPVTWLASGDVLIDGDIDLSGEDGLNGEDTPPSGSPVHAIGGAGGFPGGLGGVVNEHTQQSGYGPGYGSNTTGGGGGAGYFTDGAGGYKWGCNLGTAGGGKSYGNVLLVPLMAGSGGAGGSSANGVNGGGGGAGGGALLIASSTTITLNGIIDAKGGDGGESTTKTSFGGGGGSGGAVRLAAVTISGSGEIIASGGTGGISFYVGDCSSAYGTQYTIGYGGNGSDGRTRLEAFNHQFTGTVTPDFARRTPYAAFPQATLAPELRVISVGGIPLENPGASFNPPDITLDSNEPVDVVVRAYNIPAQSGEPLTDTVIDLHLFSENAADIVKVSSTSPLIPTENPGESEVTISVTFPAGFSRGFVHSTWGP